MEAAEKIYREISKELLNTFFYNRRVFAKQEKEDSGKVIFLTKYQSIDSVKIKYALQNKLALMTYQQNQNNLRWVCLDFDIQKCVQKEKYDFLQDMQYREKLIEDVEIAIKKLKELNINYVMEYSGNRGIHIWIFFEEEVSKALGYTIIEKILEKIKFRYTFVEDSGIMLDKYPKNGNAEGNRIGLGVKMPLSYHQKSECYSYIIEKTSDIRRIQDLDVDFLKFQLDMLRKIKRNSVDALIKVLNISNILNSEQFSRINGMIEREYSLDEIKNMLKKSKIFQNIFNKSNLSEYERDILVGTLSRIRSRNNPSYGKEILKDFFKTLDNYNEDITTKKLEKLENLYPIKIEEIEKKLGIKCEYCKKYKINNTMELIDGIEFASFNENKVLINWVTKAEIDYLINNDEVPLEFIQNRLQRLKVDEIEKKIEKVKKGEEHQRILPYKYIRHEKEKDRILYSYSAEDRVISTTIMFLIDNILGGEYTNSSSYSYKINRYKYKNYKIFEPWNNLWMNYKKDISDKIYDPSYDNYYLLKLDLRNFYDSINHIFLRDYLYNRPTDNIKMVLNNMDSKQRNEYKNLCEFLIQLCECTNPERGVPQGPAFARYLAEIYIHQIDLLIKAEINEYTEFYYRYVDDIVILVEDGEKAKNILKKITDKLKVLDLEMNYKKQIFGQVKDIKYEVISDDIEKYFIDGIEEETPQFIKNKAKYILQNMFEKIKKDENGELDYKNIPFFLTHLMDEKYIETNKEDIIKCITNANIGRGSMYKHFYNNIIFRNNIEDLGFYEKIEGLSRANFIDALLKNSYRVEKYILQKIYNDYIEIGDLQEYEKIELYMLALQNNLTFNEKKIDYKLLLDCIKYTSKLNLNQSILHNILIEIQKNDNKEERLKVLEEILGKAERIERIDEFIDTVVSTIEQIDNNKGVKVENMQVLYNLIAFATLYLNNTQKVRQIWEVLLDQYNEQTLNKNEWYRYRGVMLQHKYNDSTIISFLTSELSGENIVENEEISYIELMYIASLIIYISKIDIENKILNNEDLKEAIKKIAEQKNMLILKWCIDGNTEYFPNKEIALLNSQYNDRIVMICNRNQLLVRGRKEIFGDSKIQKEECCIDGEERFFKIYKIDSPLADIYQVLDGKNFFEALKLLENIFYEIEKETLVNIFEKGSIDCLGKVKYQYSKYDKVFVVDERMISEKRMEEISRIIIEKILQQNKLEPFKYEYGRIIESNNICREFVPNILKSYYEKIEFLIELNKNIEEIPINMRNNDYEIEKAKILTLKNSKIEVLKDREDYASNYKIIKLYNTFKNSNTDKILYGKVKVKENNLFDVIDTLKNSISMNIDHDIIKSILEQLDKDLNNIEEIIKIESNQIQKVTFETSEDEETNNIFINKTKYNINELRIIEFGKKEGIVGLSEKDILKLATRKYTFFAEKNIIILPEFIEKVLEIIKNKEDIYDSNNILKEEQLGNSAYYKQAIKNIEMQNDISKEEAEKKLKMFLRKYDSKYYDAIIELISKYKIIDEEDRKNFIKELKKYLDDNNYVVCSLKNYINDRNGLDCILRKEKGFDRSERYAKRLRLNLCEKEDSTKEKIVIVSDIGISGGQAKKRLNDCKVNLAKYKEVIFLNCIYTDKYKENMTKEWKELKIKFKGREIKSSQYMYNKLHNKSKVRLEEFFQEEENRKILELKMPFNEKVTYRRYIQEIEKEDTINILLGRFKSMPKPHHIIFDDTIFKYRKDK